MSSIDGHESGFMHKEDEESPEYDRELEEEMGAAGQKSRNVFLKEETRRRTLARSSSISEISAALKSDAARSLIPPKWKARAAPLKAVKAKWSTSEAITRNA